MRIFCFICFFLKFLVKDFGSNLKIFGFLLNFGKLLVEVFDIGVVFDWIVGVVMVRVWEMWDGWVSEDRICSSFLRIGFVGDFVGEERFIVVL